MAPSAEVKIRAAPRYRVVTPDGLPVEIQGASAKLSIVDVSESGACFLANGLLAQPNFLNNKVVRIGATSDSIAPSIIRRAWITSDSERLGVAFDDRGSDERRDWIKRHVDQAVLEEDHVGLLISEIDRRLATRTDSFPLISAKDLAAWIRLNKLDGHEARVALRLASWALDDDHLLDRRRFADLTLQPLRSICGLDPAAHLHCVSMRMPRTFSDKVWKKLFDQELRLERVRYVGNLAELENQAGVPREPKQWLVGIDVFINRGHTRDAFLETVLKNKAVMEGYDGLFVVAPVAYEDALETRIDVPAHLCHGRVTRAGRTFGKNERPPAYWPTPISTDDRRLMAKLHDRLHSGLPFSDESENKSRRRRRRHKPPNATTTARGSSLATFYYGCPPYNPPLLWSESNNWTPLFKTVDFYVPTARPFPRAPIFDAYPRTLRDLRTRIGQGQPVLLYAPSGAGKTFLAARAIEIERSRSYALWHDCLELETIDHVLEQIDSFLEALGISPWLLREWGQGQKRIDELADKLVKTLLGLDRSVLLVFDGMQRLFSHSDARIEPDEESRVLQFLRGLSAGVRSAHRSDGDRIAVDEAATRHASRRASSARHSTSIVFLLQTHLGVEAHSRTSPVLDDELVKRVKDKLALTDGDLLELPIRDRDVFHDPVPLARRLLARTPHLTNTEKRYVRLLSHQDPYKTWLVAFALRRADPKKRQADLPRLSRSRYYGVLALHHAAKKFLTPNEILLLEIASVFFLPWSITDIETVLATLGKHTFVVGDVVEHLLKDNAPFVIRLSSADEPDGLVNHRLRNPTHIYRGDLFEMPTVSARFFREELDMNHESARPVYAALADLMWERWQRSKSSHLATSAQGHKHDTTSLVEHIRYLCLAHELGKAAHVYWDEKKSLGWERSRRLGQQILEAARKATEQGSVKGTDRGALSPHEECLVRATYGRSLAELMELVLARECLEQGPWFERADLIDRASIVFEKARCEQYAGHAEAAMRLYQQVLEWVGEVAAPQALVLSAECSLALAQCAMTQGQLAEGRRRVRKVREQLSARLSDAERQRLELKSERHEGTIELLAGDNHAAKGRFKALADKHRTGGDGKAVACYKAARTAMEQARVLGAWQRALNCNHLQRQIDLLLEEARSMLIEATATLERVLPLDARWHSAALRLGELEWALLSRRYPAIPGQQAVSDLREKLEDANRGMQRSGPTSRKLEIGYLSKAVDCEEELTRLMSEEKADRLGVASTWQKRFEEVVAGHDHNPYQRGRAFCELLEFLYRLRDGTDEREHIDRLMTIAYAHGERAYLDIDAGVDDDLGRSKMSRASEALQVMAFGIYGSTFGLQERLESALWFDWWGVKAPCAFCAGGIPTPMGELDRLLDVRLRNAVEHGEKYMTIPAKVYCNLTRDVGTYERLKSGSWYPRGRPQLANCTTRMTLADTLVRHITRWIDRVNDLDRLEDFSKKRGIGCSDNDRKVALAAIKELNDWFAP